MFGFLHLSLTLGYPRSTGLHWEDHETDGGTLRDLVEIVQWLVKQAESVAIRAKKTHELKFRRWRAESPVERVRQEAKLQTNGKVRVGKDLSMAERTAKAGVISVSPLQRTGSPQEPSRVHLAVDNTLSVPTLTFYSLTPTVFCPTQYVKPHSLTH